MTGSGRYILADHHIAVPCDDFGDWAAFVGVDANCRVGEAQVGPVWISTKFFGIDMNHFDGEPVLFETMSFNDDGEILDQWRYRTWAEAERGHALIVARARAAVTETQALLDWAEGKKETPP